MKELETTKLKADAFDTPEHLKMLGISLCQDCGSHMSIDNTICYGCGFENDDQYINESAMQSIHGILITNDKPLFLVYNMSEKSDKKRRTFHIMRSGFSLCGLAVDNRNRFEVIGRMILSRIPEFYKNPCKKCLNALEKDN